VTRSSSPATVLRPEERGGGSKSSGKGRWMRWISRARFETKVQRAEPRSRGVHRNAMQAA